MEHVGILNHFHDIIGWSTYKAENKSVWHIRLQLRFVQHYKGSYIAVWFPSLIRDWSHEFTTTLQSLGKVQCMYFIHYVQEIVLDQAVYILLYSDSYIGLNRILQGSWGWFPSLIRDWSQDLSTYSIAHLGKFVFDYVGKGLAEKCLQYVLKYIEIYIIWWLYIIIEELIIWVI